MPQNDKSEKHKLFVNKNRFIIKIIFYLINIWLNLPRKIWLAF